MLQQFLHRLRKQPSSNDVDKLLCSVSVRGLCPPGWYRLCTRFLQNSGSTRTTQKLLESLPEQYVSKVKRDVNQYYCMGICCCCSPALPFGHATVNYYILIRDAGISLCASFSSPISTHFPIFPWFSSFHKPSWTDKCELQCKHIQDREKDLIQAMPSRIPTNTVCIRPS